MPLLHFDARPDWSDPAAGYQTLNAGIAAAWGAPSDKVKSLDANAQWTGPVMGTPVGDIPIGGSINFLTLFGAPIEWIVIGRDLPGMPENSITLFMKYIVALRCFDASEPNNPDGNRKNYGNNDWGVSNLRQWANSAAGPGQWYSPQHEYDAPPDTKEHCANWNPYQSDSGLLYESTARERSLLMETTRNYGGYEQNNHTCVDRVFALTTAELGVTNISKLKNDGTKIPYFTDDEKRTTKCNALCIDHSDFKGINTDHTYNYWTATSYPSNSYDIYDIQTTGKAQMSDRPRNGGIGVRLACNIPANARL